MPGSYNARERLPPLQGCIPKGAYLPAPALAPRVCPHTALPVFDLGLVEALLSEAPTPTATASWLPLHLAQTVVKWVRVAEALSLPMASEVTAPRMLTIVISSYMAFLCTAIKKLTLD
jgi:hypothetical protein